MFFIFFFHKCFSSLQSKQESVGVNIPFLFYFQVNSITLAALSCILLVEEALQNHVFHGQRHLERPMLPPCSPQEESLSSWELLAGEARAVSQTNTCPMLHTLSTLEEINLLSGTSCTFNFLLQNSQIISTHPTSSWLCSSQLIFPINDISMYLSLCFLSLQNSTLPFLWQRFWCKSPSKSEHWARKQIQPLTETREEKNSHSPWFRVMRATFSVILIYLQ